MYHPTVPQRTARPPLVGLVTVPGAGSRRSAAAYGRVGMNEMTGARRSRTVTGTLTARLLGRARERDALGRLLDDGRAGQAGVLVIHGEAGVGKTALLEHTASAARGFRIVRTLGVESEMQLPFAAVQQLCAPFLELAGHLPQPQRDALEVAFGLSAGPASDPFLVGLAVLGLLAEAAEDHPLLCLVDDAQWLDSASARTLAFVARRLLAERIALVFATRDVGATLAGLPELLVGPLSRDDSRLLLESVLTARLDERVLGRIVAEARGNQLALLELPRGLTPAQLAGGFGLPVPVPVSAGIEQAYMRRLARLPSDAQRLLLVAAADPVGDPALVWRAAKRLGIPVSAGDTVESAQLLVLSPRVAFRHPLVRSAVYRSAEPAERREVHHALAEVTDPEIDPDRRAWHRAQATAAPDEDVAVELERSAARAQARGGFAAAGAFLERAVALSSEPSRRARRALAAAQAKVRAGVLDDALGLLATAETAVPSDVEGARVSLVRAQIALVSRHANDAVPTLLSAARQLADLDPRLARETYLEALAAALLAGRLAAPGRTALDVARTARSAPPALGAPRGIDLLLDGFVTLVSEGYEAATPILREAVSAFSTGMPTAEQLPWIWPATVGSVQLWDDEQWDTLSERHVRLARETGALFDLQVALSNRAFSHLLAGQFSAAGSFLAELQAAAEVTGTNLAPYGAAGLLALRGSEAEAARLFDRSRAAAAQRGDGIALSWFDWAEAVLFNGLGRYEEALAAALRVADHPHDLIPFNWHVTELIEAAARAGTPELADDARRRLVAMTSASGTNWGLGVAARSQALLAEGQRAEELHVQAIGQLSKTRIAIDLARAHLLYGEWLRRERRRRDAREQLRTAYELFTDFGAEAFAERARLELEATGEHARKRTVDTLDELTPQETQVARLAAQGETNKEIAARLFISASTVEYHLRKAFRKLGVKSRTQLAHRSLQ